MAGYAQNTSVHCEKSRAEIETTLRRFGAGQFLSGWDQAQAYIGFSVKGRMIKMTLVLPSRESFLRTPAKRQLRSAQEVDKVWDQACREKWRALALIVKAKLVGVQERIVTLEDEFLAYTVLPEGQTVSEWLEPQVQAMIETGRMPQRLLVGTVEPARVVQSKIVNHQSE